MRSRTIHPLHVTRVEANVPGLGEQDALGDTREDRAPDLGEIEPLRKAVAILGD